MSNLPVIGNLFKTNKPPAPPALAPPPSIADATKNTKIRRAQRSSILTSGQGFLGGADILRKKLGSGILLG